MRPAALFLLPVVCTMALVGLLACSSSSDGDPKSCTTVSTDCTPLYEPTYDQIFENTLKPTCAKSGVSCHASTGHQGGLAFEDADESYRMLVEETGDARPGDPACSEIVVRITATDGRVRMPPGASIDPGAQCAIIQWIAAGAKR